MMKKKLPILNKKYLEEFLPGTGLADFPLEILDYPERVLQFGEGNFLRAFCDWIFHQMNKRGLFKGRVVAVQPIPEGRAGNLNKQDNLYTVLLHGIENGEPVEKREIVASISRSLDAYTQWDKLLELAGNPEIEIVLSNTTEAGISYSPEDRPTDSPPDSYPGKLAAFLYHRYRHFGGAPDKGMIIIPVELIERNGDTLKSIVCRLADEWYPGSGFRNWLEKENIFLNTLVDRIVTGYPFKETGKIEGELGYRDENLVAAEIFYSWIIEGDEAIRGRLPFHEAGLNVQWTDDLTPYRTRKVRILNGLHTAAFSIAYLSGIDLVRDAVNDELTGSFIRKALFQNILPVLEYDGAELESFAGQVLERFKNPYIDHKWLDISLNSIAKFRTRVLPSLMKYVGENDSLPDMLVFSLAALIFFYKGTEIRGNKLIAYRDGEEYLVSDETEVLEFFADLWIRYGNKETSLEELVREVLQNRGFWGEDLNKLSGLGTAVRFYLQRIEEAGIRESLGELV